MRMKLFIFSAVFTLLIIASFSFKVAGQEDRTQLMRDIRDSFSPLEAMLMGGAFEVIVINSRELATLAQKIQPAFSTKAVSLESRAKEEIWNDWKGFTQKSKELTDALSGLEAAAKTSNAKKTEGQIKKVLMACKNCHRAFRIPQPEDEDEYQ